MSVAIKQISVVSWKTGLSTGAVEEGLGVTVTTGESPTTVCVIVMGRPRLVGL